jgi:hypothetical protein
LIEVFTSAVVCLADAKTCTVSASFFRHAQLARRCYSRDVISRVGLPNSSRYQALISVWGETFLCRATSAYASRANATPSSVAQGQSPALPAKRAAGSQTGLCSRKARARGTEQVGEKIPHSCRILLQCTFDAITCRSPNFAPACGRVSIGRHPDKRPDSRLRLEFQPHYVIGSRRRNRRTPRSTGDAA